MPTPTQAQTPKPSLLRLPVSLRASHFDRGVHCVTIVDASGRVVVSSVAQDDAREVSDVLNSHASTRAENKALREALAELYTQFPAPQCQQEVDALNQARAALSGGDKWAPSIRRGRGNPTRNIFTRHRIAFWQS